MAGLVAGQKKGGLTFAPEAGTQRLRDVINKNVTEERPVRRHRRGLRGGMAALQAVLHDRPAHRDRRRHQGHRLARAARLRPREGRRAARAARQRARGRVVRAVRAEGADAVPVGTGRRSRAEARRCGAWGFCAAQRDVQGRGRALARPEPPASWRPSWSRAGREAADVGGGGLAAPGRGSSAWSELFREEAWRDAAQRGGHRRGGHWPRRPHDPCARHAVGARVHRRVSTRFLALERRRAAEGAVTPDCTFGDCTGCGACPALDAEDELVEVRHG